MNKNLKPFVNCGICYALTMGCGYGVYKNLSLRDQIKENTPAIVMAVEGLENELQRTEDVKNIVQLDYDREPTQYNKEQLRDLKSILMRKEKYLIRG